MPMTRYPAVSTRHPVTTAREFCIAHSRYSSSIDVGDCCCNNAVLTSDCGRSTGQTAAAVTRESASRWSKATERRLRDELNIRAQLEFVYKFTYQASYETLGSEHELCWVYLGRVDQPVVANRHEIAATRFLTVAELRQELAALPERFTPWFKLEWQRLENDHATILEQYLTPL
jgi:isopentenyldiphosphate isomerase